MGWPTATRATALATSSAAIGWRSEEHTSELQSQSNLVCRLLLDKKNPALASDSPHWPQARRECAPRCLASTVAARRLARYPSSGPLTHERLPPMAPLHVSHHVSS